ncbi:protein of unknown function [Ectopseudomonas oleovorans]|nr:protein of unknown function [Pseudomonas oleovorans]
MQSRLWRLDEPHNTAGATAVTTQARVD